MITKAIFRLFPDMQKQISQNSISQIHIPQDNQPKNPLLTKPKPTYPKRANLEPTIPTKF